LDQLIDEDEMGFPNESTSDPRKLTDVGRVITKFVFSFRDIRVDQATEAFPLTCQILKINGKPCGI
jgi:hypothetical protein